MNTVQILVIHLWNKSRRFQYKATVVSIWSLFSKQCYGLFNQARFVGSYTHGQCDSFALCENFQVFVKTELTENQISSWRRSGRPHTRDIYPHVRFSHSNTCHNLMTSQIVDLWGTKKSFKRCLVFKLYLEIRCCLSIKNVLNSILNQSQHASGKTYIGGATSFLTGQDKHAKHEYTV